MAGKILWWENIHLGELHTIKTEKFHYENGSLRRLIDFTKIILSIVSK
jgi:hypothetical protein